MTKLVEISGLNIRFTGERTVYAVNDLSLSLGDGEVLGLLGESGSGKSVTLRALMRLQNGLAVPAITYLEAMRWRGPALAAYLAAVTGTDAVLAPVAPMPAVTIAESDVGNSLDAEAVIQRITKFTRPVNYLGLPSLSIPSGFTKSGLPVGLQLIGRSFDEAMLLRIGAAFQRATDYHKQVPKPA